MPRSPFRLAKRSAHDAAIELSHAFAQAREKFMESATNWVNLRHRFLVRTGKQPDSKGEQRPDRRGETRR